MSRISRSPNRIQPCDPEPLTFDMLQREAAQLLDALRSYQEVTQQQPQETPEGPSQLFGQIEQMCIHQRILRILVWMQLVFGHAQGDPADAEAQDLAHVLCDATSLRKASELAAQKLPPELRSISRRSQALLSRVARLNESCNQRYALGV